MHISYGEHSLVWYLAESTVGCSRFKMIYSPRLGTWAGGEDIQGEK